MYNKAQVNHSEEQRKLNTDMTTKVISKSMWHIP